MPEVRADAPSPFVIRETHPGRAFPLFYTGATLDPHSGRIVSEGWAGDPSAERVLAEVEDVPASKLAKLKAKLHRFNAKTGRWRKQEIG